MLDRGQTLTHYRISAKLGAGGMGEVYRATDTRLGREVALKVLPAAVSRDDEALARLEREAMALAALNHPHIAAIHGFEAEGATHFLVLELVEGLTLAAILQSKPLGVAESLRLARQIAEALDAAHARGIIHRDLKPGNIKITPDGRVKVLDFGLAKGIDRAARASNPHAETLRATTTQPGTVLGTPAYMSPEQARGQEVDKRTDVWAFGCCLYECLTGSKPFRGETVTDLISEVLRSDPDWSALPAETPPEVITLLRRCLEKDPRRRLSSLGDIALLLEDSTPARPRQPAAVAPRGRPVAAPEPPAHPARRTRLAPVLACLMLAAVLGLALVRYAPWKTPAPINRVGQIGSLAVLPFVNMSADQENEYLSDGITEELLNALARVPGLRVPARSSSFAFKHKKEDVRRIGDLLQVACVLEGSVRKAGDQLRITVQLVQVSDGFQLWSETYDRNMTNIFAIQEDIARNIVARLGLPVPSSTPQAAAAPTSGKVGAYELYLKGNYHLRKLVEPEVRQAIALFEQALALQPDYGPAYAGLAGSYGTLRFFGYVAPQAVADQHRAACLKALELDQSSSTAHLNIAALLFYHDRDWTSAERAFKRALELNPADVRARFHYATLLSVLERHPEAMAQARMARNLDPLDVTAHSVSGWVAIRAGDYDFALQICQQALAMAPDFFQAHQVQGYALFRKGERAEGIAKMEKAAELAPVPEVLGHLGLMYGRTGRQADARRMLDRLLASAQEKYVAAATIANVYDGLGDIEQTNHWMRKAIADREARVVFLKTAADDITRANPHYSEWLAQAGLNQGH